MVIPEICCATRIELDESVVVLLAVPYYSVSSFLDYIIGHYDEELR